MKAFGLVWLLPALAAAQSATVTLSPWQTGEVTPDGTCGGSTGFVCSPVWGACCSKDGKCGRSSKFCGDGCQSIAGNCNAAAPAPEKPLGPGSVSPDGSCGGDNKFVCGGSTFGGCCSLQGWCGNSTAHCGNDCLPDFGTCGPPSNITANGQCGANGKICPGSGFGDCCSSTGWCGGDEDFCGAGCQNGFGNCTLTDAGNVSTDGSCGKNGKICKGSSWGDCCSADGYCGKGDGFCSADDFCRTGCQLAYGLCPGISADSECGSRNGRTCAGSGLGNCCSANGYCGSTGSHCGQGCQKGASSACLTKNIPTTDGSCGSKAGLTCAGGPFDGQCCSAAGWCGTSSHCGSGCANIAGRDDMERNINAPPALSFFRQKAWSIQDVRAAAVRCARREKSSECDEAIPTCTNCKTAGWTCPGPSNIGFFFRHQTASDMARRIVGNDGSTVATPIAGSSTDPETWKRPLSPPARDRATTFFMRQYVFGISTASDSFLLGDSHEYLPILMKEESAFGLLSTVVAAAGFAALSNAGNVAEWRSESFRLYQNVIVQLQHALHDPVQKVSDETLGAVLLMGTFETIAFPDTSSMDTFSQHIIAAARCIEMRGPERFRSPAGVKLFMQMRRNMITTCHQLQEPFPFEVSKWSQWAEPHQPEAYIPVNRLSQINEGLASTRAKLKYLGITDPEIISQSLMPFDRMMEQWAEELPPIWEAKVMCEGIGVMMLKKSVIEDGNPINRDLQHDIYNDPWIAYIWNSYRNARLLIHESIIIATLKHGSQEQKETLHSSFTILRRMADEIGYSAAYHLGHRRQDDITMHHPQTGHLYNTPAPGGFLLLWPLFFAAIQRTSPRDQRLWVAGIIRQVGRQMGLQIALSMAGLLEKDEKEFAFPDEETFLLGEWHPN
ncbi:hypothetical protein HYE68_008880 [Fusarium pseudograminearum]|nr:hypothetical protein HYE68_008880 [Fusarium pseudograminearum]